jgi:hypothetical protein
MTDGRSESRPQDALAQHAAGCEECRANPPPTLALVPLLAAEVPLDAAALSRSALRVLRPELARLAAAAFRRRVAAGLLVALAPLPLIVACNAYLLRAAYALVALVVPSALAAYLVFSYAALVLLLMAAAYGSIPLLVARQLTAGGAGEQLSARNA